MFDRFSSKASLFASKGMEIQIEFTLSIIILQIRIKIYIKGSDRRK
jgi:hypothetical protein